MLDFSFVDPRLLFPNIAESTALAMENIILLLELFGLILMVMGEWKLFKKFGEKSWKSIVPYYNTYLTYKHTWSKRAFWVYILSSILFNAAQTASKDLAQYYPDKIWPTLIILIALPLGIVAATCSVLYAIRMAEVFGKGKLFCVGLLILYPVFIAILGFGKSKYVGICGADQTTEATDDLQSESEVI
jgi:hypothetical protein